MFSTSRYSTQATRRLAGIEAKRLGQSYVARGKKTIDTLAAEARARGEETLSIIEERKGVAAIVATIRISPGGRWSWEKEEPFGKDGPVEAGSGAKGAGKGGRGA